MFVTYAPINFADKLARFSDQWSPKIIAQMNEYHFKLVKVQGEFVWHAHDDTDEVFIVLDGALTIQLRDGAVDLHAGEMFVIPRGVEHKPFAKDECRLMLVEPAGTISTGAVRSELTARDGVWV
jgi:mannose-6-phosphate isomerase-like protein (cupin superfamily)